MGQHGPLRTTAGIIGEPITNAASAHSGSNFFPTLNLGFCIAPILFFSTCVVMCACHLSVLHVWSSDPLWSKVIRVGVFTIWSWKLVEWHLTKCHAKQRDRPQHACFHATLYWSVGPTNISITNSLFVWSSDRWINLYSHLFLLLLFSQWPNNCLCAHQSISELKKSAGNICECFNYFFQFVFEWVFLEIVIRLLLRFHSSTLLRHTIKRPQ